MRNSFLNCRYTLKWIVFNDSFSFYFVFSSLRSFSWIRSFELFLLWILSTSIFPYLILIFLWRARNIYLLKNLSKITQLYSIKCSRSFLLIAFLSFFSFTINVYFRNLNIIVHQLFKFIHIYAFQLRSQPPWFIFSHQIKLLSRLHL